MDNNRPILVTGSGRSGTSLCMYFLEALGAVMSPEMIPASPQNPDGGREDTEIFQLHQALQRSLNTHASLPMPPRWLEQEAVQRTKQALRKIVSERLQIDPSRPWAVKDPNLAYFLPLWTHLFNGLKQVPVHVLCVRSPEAMCRSMESQYGVGPDESLMVWMLRNAYTLRHTGGNCLVVHYEAWEQDGLAQLGRLAAQLLPGQAHTAESLRAVLEQVFKPSLNRAGASPLAPTANPAARRFYETLQQVPGGAMAGRDALQVAEECLAQIEQFRGMASVAQMALRQVAGLRAPGREPGARNPAGGNAEAAAPDSVGRLRRLLADAQQALKTLQDAYAERVAEADTLRVACDRLTDSMDAQQTIAASTARHVKVLEARIMELRSQLETTRRLWAS
ncbi:hypothetical protein [Piscinibacter defluvii]|uniref:hypothetical protein n=1 Tax=Piscinibacter defluvii TaxID=1796922 RepID=UPI001F0BBDD4|nr:hypothetical protein [Piscinibacter defluvii]